MYIFSDESMDRTIKIVGAVSAKLSEMLEFEQEVFLLRAKYNDFDEIKWNNLPKSRTEFYLDVVDLFFKYKSLRFHSNSFLYESFQHQVQYKLIQSITWKLKKIGYKQQCYVKLDEIGKKSKKSVENMNRMFRQHRDSIYLGNYQKQNTLENDIDISECSSHVSTMLQLADLFSGAVMYELNQDEVERTKFKDYLQRKLIEGDINEPLGLSSANSQKLWGYYERKFQHYNLHANRIS